MYGFCWFGLFCPVFVVLLLLLAEFLCLILTLSRAHAGYLHLWSAFWRCFSSCCNRRGLEHIVSALWCCVRLQLSLIPSYTYMSRVYMHLIIILHVAHTLLVFRFAGLCSLRWHLSLSTSIDNRLNLLYIYITFIHTTALLIDLQSLHMSDLCHIIPYLYYSALISLYLFSLLSSYAFSICIPSDFKMCLLELFIS